MAQNYKVGDRVAMPAGYSDKWLDAVIIRIEPGSPYPYRVHPLGYVDTMDQSFSAQTLKPPGTVKTEPIGGIKDDPHLMAIIGQRNTMRRSSIRATMNAGLGREGVCRRPWR